MMSRCEPDQAEGGLSAYHALLASLVSGLNERPGMIDLDICKKKLRKTNIKVTTLGIDLARSLFRVHQLYVRGAVKVQKQLTRKQLLPFLARLERCVVGIEACGGAHYWAREIAKLGSSLPCTRD